MKSTVKIVIAFVVVTFAASVQAGHHGKTKANIVETAAAAGQFETLIAAAKAAGLARKPLADRHR